MRSAGGVDRGALSPAAAARRRPLPAQWPPGIAAPNCRRSPLPWATTLLPAAVPVRHVLFLCARNRLRSPTAEQLFADWPGIETASAGVNADADTPVTPELLAWADLIFVMERRHRSKLSAAFQRHLSGKRIVCLDIPDDYAFMDPALVRRLQQAVTPHLPRRHPAL